MVSLKFKSLVFFGIILIFFSCGKKGEKNTFYIEKKQVKKEVVQKKAIGTIAFLNNTSIFNIDKSTIQNLFNKPLKITIPEYECGSFSSEVQSQEFEILHFEGFQFIGNEKGKYFLEEIDFKKISKDHNLKINDVPINSNTTLDTFIREFSENLKFQQAENLIILPTQFDFYFVLQFENGKLAKAYLEESC